MPNLSRRRNGSSPLARGLPVTVRTPQPECGIIPARAGFTIPRTCADMQWKDHPRSRGVYLFIAVIAERFSGSSPLARGLPVPKGTINFEARIIPARAGFTSRQCLRCRPSPDHPRSRGVYETRTTPLPRPMGSSPLARGLLARLAADKAVVGIIPARAGFTAFPQRTLIEQWDHPRSRGVYKPGFTSLVDVKGSSPLARGLPHRGVIDVTIHGIIPARAGFTILLILICRWPRDHPRSRGVYPGRWAAMFLISGSSPLARGLPLML